MLITLLEASAKERSHSAFEEASTVTLINARDTGKRSMSPLSEDIVTLLSPTGDLTSQAPGRTSDTNCWKLFPATAGVSFPFLSFESFAGGAAAANNGRKARARFQDMCTSSVE